MNREPSGLDTVDQNQERVCGPVGTWPKSGTCTAGYLYKSSVFSCWTDTAKCTVWLMWFVTQKIKTILSESVFLIFPCVEHNKIIKNPRNA